MKEESLFTLNQKEKKEKISELDPALVYFLDKS